MQHVFRYAVCLLALAACEVDPTLTAPEPRPIGVNPNPVVETLPPPAPSPAPRQPVTTAPLGGAEIAEATGGLEADGIGGVPVALAEPSDCGASSRQAYVGRPAAEAGAIPSSAPKRVLGVDDIADGTPDPSRLTVKLGSRADGDVIARIYCG